MSIIILTGQYSAFTYSFRNRGWGNFLSEIGIRPQLSFNLYRYYLMSYVLIPFMKEIVEYLVFKTEILNGLSLWHCFRLVANEQPLKITAAIHTYYIFSLQQRRSYLLFFEAIRLNWTLTHYYISRIKIMFETKVGFSLLRTFLNAYNLLDKLLIIIS